MVQVNRLSDLGPDAWRLREQSVDTEAADFLRALLAALEASGVPREEASYVTLGELMDRYGV